MNIVLISTYELGRQPFGLASPAAWFRARGHAVVTLDLTRETLDEEALRAAGLVAFYVPMHTATRLAAGLIDSVRGINPRAHLCFYGLYAPVNEDYLRGLGVGTILGGEFEEGLMSLAERLGQAAGNQNGGVAQTEPVISLARQKFIVPDRAGMPGLGKYARIVMPGGERRIAGSTEATRGCKHLCRHCPIVPVYNGAFRVVEREVVLEDIRRQVAAGAQHITFGDPDFFNGPGHALSIVQAVHGEFPELTYDVTIKIEHLRQHDHRLATLRDTGCLFVISAVESVDDAVLEKFDKGHTRADFLAVAARFRELGMTLLPTFVPFTPWTTLEGYNDLLDVVAREDLCENVAPIQLAIRLLIPAGSRLLDLPDARARVGAFDSAALVYPWKHEDARVDALARAISDLVQRGDALKLSRTEIFSHIRRAAKAAAGDRAPLGVAPAVPHGTPVPYLDEPWYCCAEPMNDQFVSIGKVKEGVAKADQFV
ncbi:MAG TPA: CUAEP/CCAEP-tail radical SAM protein [Candidatus Dormibacteraeota bacterium]|nr:CUAEP/CCAEP-tail radical SAM protein [Candidatus Dormibacteraeota bacterium]